MPCTAPCEVIPLRLLEVSHVFGHARTRETLPTFKRGAGIGASHSSLKLVLALSQVTGGLHHPETVAHP